MFSIIVLLIVGGLLAYISQFNLMPVSLYLGGYAVTDIPLFYVIIGSLLVGMGLFYAMQLLKDINSSWIMRGKNKVIKKSNDEVLELTKRIHQLELENEKLKHAKAEPSDTRAL